MLSEEEAVAACTMLRSVASSKRDALLKRLQSACQAGGTLSLDKSGTELQEEALQLALLMRGLPPTETACHELLQAIRRWQANGEVASFLQYWSQLGLMAGVYATGAGDEVRTAWVDWYRGPPGSARYLPSLLTLREPRALEEFVLQGWAPGRPLIGRESLVTALGSCFADEIRLWLRARGFRVNEDFRSGSSYPHVEDSTVPLLQCSAGLVNTFVLLQQFEWAFEGRNFEDDLWCSSSNTPAPLPQHSFPSTPSPAPRPSHSLFLAHPFRPLPSTALS